MTIKLEVRTIGDSAGVLLPHEVMAKLRLEKGDALFLTEAPDGYRITAHDPDFARQMALAQQVMDEDRNVLKQLAK
jgi:putative addiction module antidote